MELDEEFARNTGFLLIGVIVGAAIVYLAPQVTGTGGAGDELVSFLENQSGQDLENMGTEKAGEFYKVDIRDEENTVTTYYTDGELFTANMQNMQELLNAQEALVDYQECLADSGTVMFGNATQVETQQQIELLGGAQLVAPIYQDVNNNETLRQALQLGIQQVPAFYRNQTVIQGAQNLETVEEFTGCTLETN